MNYYYCNKCQCCFPDDWTLWPGAMDKYKKCIIGSLTRWERCNCTNRLKYGIRCNRNNKIKYGVRPSITKLTAYESEVLLLLYRMVSFVLCVSVYGIGYFVGMVVGRWRNWVGVGTPEESVKEKRLCAFQ